MQNPYDKIYNDIYLIKDSIKLLEEYFSNDDFNQLIKNLDFKIRLIKVIKFLDEDYTFNRIFYQILKMCLYAQNYNLIRKIINIYEIKLTCIDKMINEITIQDENSFKNFKSKKLTIKQLEMINFLESLKQLI